MEENRKGVDKNFRHVIKAATADAATSLYQGAAARLLDVNTWHQTAGKGTAVFQRMDSNGMALTGDVQLKDFIRIDIPGPGAHKHFDWVKVEYLSREELKTELRVRPCAAPDEESRNTGHFLSDDATSTFVVALKDLEIHAVILGRDEKPNLEGGDTIIEKARNILVGIGAIAGAADLQWNRLAKGFLEKAQAAS